LKHTHTVIVQTHAHNQTRMWLWTLLGGALAFPVGVPLQIVRPTEDHKDLEVVTESIAQLIDIDTPVAILSVVGPYHSGKSFLLNALMGNMKTFQVGPKTHPETMGIWVCRTNLTSSDGAQIWLMDSEGFFGPQVSEEYDAKIFTVATLLASHLVYNTVKIIDQQAVNLFETLVRRAQLYRTRSSMETVDEVCPNFLRDSTFPPLTWTVEDFVQEIPPAHEKEGATGWLRTYLTTTDNSTQPYLTKLFDNLTVKTLFLPAIEKKQLQNLSLMRFEELTTDFRSEVADLRRHLIKNSRSKPFDDKKLTGRTLGAAVQFLVNGLGTGLFPELPSMWLSWSKQVAERSLQDAISWFNTLSKNIPFGPVKKFQEALRDSENRAKNFYVKLLEDFDAAKNMNALEVSIQETRNEVMKQYETKAHVHFQHSIADAEEAFQAELAKIEFPMEPAVLQSVLDKTQESHTSKLANDWVEFRSESYEDAPVFNWTGPLPVQLLQGHLESWAKGKIAENDRSIQVLFQNAMQAVFSSIDFDLQARRSMLFGRKMMQDLMDSQMTVAVQMYEENLDGYQWVKFHDQFKLHRSHIQTEVQEKLRRFETENAASLNAHFSQAYEAAFEHYKVQKNLLRLPLDDEELQQAQTTLRQDSALQIHSMVKKADLSDTNQFSEAGARLDRQMVLEWNRLQKKNIELWRVHSDEATSCALEKLRTDEQGCAFFHLCVWHLIPWMHRKTCQNHLLACLEKHQQAQTMSVGMQHKIFDSWYEKDLAYEASFSRNNFMAICGAGLLFLLMCLLGTRRRSYDTNRYDTPKHKMF